MTEQEMVIIGNEKLTIPVSNTYDSGVKITIGFAADKSCRIELIWDDNRKSDDVTDKCKKIEIADHESYRRLKREYAFTIGKDVFWGLMRKYSSNRDKELQLVRIAADTLNIPFGYEVVKETSQR